MTGNMTGFLNLEPKFTRAMDTKTQSQLGGYGCVRDDYAIVRSKGATGAMSVRAALAECAAAAVCLPRQRIHVENIRFNILLFIILMSPYSNNCLITFLMSLKIQI